MITNFCELQMSLAQSLIQAQVISFTFTFHQTDKKTEYRHFSPEIFIFIFWFYFFYFTIYTVEPKEDDQ